jgi:F-type H+-transporting ATPase subunit b
MMKTVRNLKFEVRSFIARNQKSITFVLLSILPVLLLASLSLASGGEGGEGEAQQSLFKAYFWPVINFLFLIVLMVYMLKKMDIKGYFKKRTELIEQTLKEAKEARELAQKALAEVEERLKVKDTEIQEIIQSAKHSGEREKTRLAEEGEKMKEKILEQAKTNIDFEVKKAKEAIKAEAVDIALELAEKKLREKLTREEQMKLLEESVAKIEGKK